MGSSLCKFIISPAAYFVYGLTGIFSAARTIVLKPIAPTATLAGGSYALAILDHGIPPLGRVYLSPS